MGAVVLVWYAVLAVAGAGLLVGGLGTGLRWLAAAGVCLLVALACAWVLGPPAAVAGAAVCGLVLVAGLLRRSPPGG